jgi:hypothetical protein
MADHACVDDSPSGSSIPLKHPFPKKWFRVGQRSVIDPATHKTLKESHKASYVSGYEEGPFGYLCLKADGGYLAITTSDFGPGADYSKVAPKCLKCSDSSTDLKEFASGTGLRLGQTKAEAAAQINVALPADVVDLTYDETEDNGKVLHTESLHLEFKNNMLVRLTIYDYREGA